MWLIPSRERPHRLQQLVTACKKARMTTSAAVLVDDDDPNLESYKNISLPKDWRLEVGPRGGLSEIYNNAYDRHPDEKWYGILCDDVIPETPRFDLKLIEVAGNDGMAVPKGGHHPVVPPHFVLGGDLVRDTGWLSLPGLDRIFIDTVWMDIAKERGVLRYAWDVVLSHHHFSNGKALYDKTYRKLRKAEDKAIYEAWKADRRTL